MIVDGFGLWEPIGHVDFFPNGGQEQPGCTDMKPSIISSQFGGTLTRESACSHIRAFHIYVEALLNKSSGKRSCKFLAFKCTKGMQAFQNGECFPQLDNPDDPLALNDTYLSDFGSFGDDTRGNGVMYFVTRESAPFCGKFNYSV